MSERIAYLVGGVRTPMGRYGGALSGVRPDDLPALVVREAVNRAGVPDDAVDEVVLGAANQSGEDNRNVARMAALLAGLPDSTPGYTVNRLCASGLQAVVAAAQTIRVGEADVIVAGGVESMTRAPWVMAKPGTPWARPGEVSDTSLGWRFINPRMRELDGGKATISMGETAEEVAALDGITREESDSFALRSQERAVAAAKDGRFDAELCPVETACGHQPGTAGPAQAGVPGRWSGDRGVVLAAVRWRGRADRRERSGRRALRPDAAGARRCRCQRCSAAVGHGAGPGCGDRQGVGALGLVG
jgi:acetyl-CoA acetyltransferase family protein